MTRTIARHTPWIVLTASVVFGQTARDGTVAYVFEIKGHWKTQYVEELARGRALHENDRVEPGGVPGKRAGNHIFVGYVDGRVDRRDCGDTGASCTTALEIGLKGTNGPGSAKPAPALGDRLQRVWESLTLAELPKAVLTMSRGRRMREDPQEAVISVERGQPDLAPALLAMPPGTFTAELTPMANNGEPVRISIQWTPPQALASGPSVNPGLYRLQLLGAGAESNAVAVLVAPSGRASALRDDFAALAQISRDWPESMTAARHDYLGAVLMQFARQPPAGK